MGGGDDEKRVRAPTRARRRNRDAVATATPRRRDGLAAAHRCRPLTPRATPTPRKRSEPTATPTAGAGPGGVAPKRIDDPADCRRNARDRRVGRLLIANERSASCARGARDELAILYGGNSSTPTLRPAGEPGRDNFGAMIPLINLSLTVNVQDIVVVNDGANGEPAVLRTVGVDDLLDAFDLVNAIKAFGFGMVPESAQDRDLPIDIVTEYTLGLGDEAIRIETTIDNHGDEDSTYVATANRAARRVVRSAPSFGDALIYDGSESCGRGVATTKDLVRIIPDPLPAPRSSRAAWAVRHPGIRSDRTS